MRTQISRLHLNGQLQTSFSNKENYSPFTSIRQFSSSKSGSEDCAYRIADATPVKQNKDMVLTSPIKLD